MKVEELERFGAKIQMPKEEVREQKGYLYEKLYK